MKLYVIVKHKKEFREMFGESKEVHEY